jgi:hypothetical protein
MAEAKHTPGEWTSESPDEFGDYNICPADGVLAVAAVVSNLRPPAEVAANARLIAAAPDMLLSLVWLHGLLENWQADSDEQFPLALAAARAAIAKATGQSLAAESVAHGNETGGPQEPKP